MEFARTHDLAALPCIPLATALVLFQDPKFDAPPTSRAGVGYDVLPKRPPGTAASYGRVNIERVDLVHLLSGGSVLDISLDPVVALHYGRRVILRRYATNHRFRAVPLVEGVRDR